MPIMLTIELTKTEQNDFKSSHLIVNGKSITSSWGIVFRDRISGGIDDDATSQEILRYPLAEVFQNINEIRLPFVAEWCDDLETVRLSAAGHRKNKPQNPHLSFEFRFDSEEWARPWSITHFAETIEQTVKALSLTGISTFRDEEFVTNDFGFSCEIDNLATTGEEEIQRWIPVLQEIMNDVHDQLIANTAGNSISQAFRFPAHIATACEQYLIYFGQFLSDIGIEAAVDLSHASDHLLFRVTPKDSKQALEAIRSALNEYLQLPSDPLLQSNLITSNEIAVLQYQANVAHLQSQLTLAQAINQAKDATIQALQLANYQLEQISITVPRLPNPTSKAESKSDSEELIDGVLSVKKTEIKGIVVHWPEIVRKLKRRFKPTE